MTLLRMIGVAALAASMMVSIADAQSLHSYAAAFIGDNTIFFVDTSPLPANGTPVWVLLVPEKGFPRPSGTAAYSMSQETYDCTQPRKLLMGYTVFYKLNGESLDSTVLSYVPEPIVPDTAGETLASVVCGDVPPHSPARFSTALEAVAVARHAFEVADKELAAKPPSKK